VTAAARESRHQETSSLHGAITVLLYEFGRAAPADITGTELVRHASPVRFDDVNAVYEWEPQATGLVRLTTEQR
jgi:hypothetical protein